MGNTGTTTFNPGSVRDMASPYNCLIELHHTISNAVRSAYGSAYGMRAEFIFYIKRADPRFSHYVIGVELVLHYQ